MKFQQLSDRKLIKVSGSEAEAFLENIITCSITGLAQDEGRFGALLTPQGKILFDFLISRQEDHFLFDISQTLAADFIKRLTFYKLRADVTIEIPGEGISVFAFWNDLPKKDTHICIKDPRHSQLGWRCYGQTPPQGSAADYELNRISLCIPDGGKDFQYGDAYPHETLMDQFGGVDFKKGCYVGQEVVSRMQHRGTTKKRIIHVSSESGLPVSGTPVTANGKAAGTLGSVHGNKGLALLRLDRVASAQSDDNSAEGAPIMAGDIEIKVEIPDWADFTLTGNPRS